MEKIFKEDLEPFFPEPRSNPGNEQTWRGQCTLASSTVSFPFRGFNKDVKGFVYWIFHLTVDNISVTADSSAGGLKKINLPSDSHANTRITKMLKALFIGSFTSQLTIFQWQQIDVQAVWRRRLTYYRTPKQWIFSRVLERKARKI